MAVALLPLPQHLPPLWSSLQLAVLVQQHQLLVSPATLVLHLIHYHLRLPKYCSEPPVNEFLYKWCS